MFDWRRPDKWVWWDRFCFHCYKGVCVRERMCVSTVRVCVTACVLVQCVRVCGCGWVWGRVGVDCKHLFHQRKVCWVFDHDPSPNFSFKGGSFFGSEFSSGSTNWRRWFIFSRRRINSSTFCRLVSSISSTSFHEKWDLLRLLKCHFPLGYAWGKD